MRNYAQLHLKHHKMTIAFSPALSRILYIKNLAHSILSEQKEKKNDNSTLFYTI